ncbi:hypothetical protein TanjilG_14267 [Lupinus angustifolius]|uniref:SCP domain-containing protein n=1 Tax=Lupinus angustifolius TaxID=3871 RepID=A0A1J7HA93_LUPAN|nr:PREDICTED: STS14 protein-like [Lupinus angustifolius]OIW09744.1 hypothetical protein TanjilG_14267 [Lupinus angustifolius]
MKIVHCPLFLLATIAIFHISAQGSTPPRTVLEDSPSLPLPSAARDFLEAHNKARAEVGVQPLNWSQQLAFATSRLVRYQRINNACQFANLTAGKYGANQLWARGSAVTPRVAVEDWVKQKQFYNHSNNSCLPNHRCGVYTQVVWKNSTSLGCAQATCVKEKTSLTICFYDPPGNYVGESPYP